MTAWILQLVRFQVSRKRASQMWHGRLQRTRDGRLAGARRAKQQHAPADRKQRIEIDRCGYLFLGTMRFTLQADAKAWDALNRVAHDSFVNRADLLHIQCSVADPLAMHYQQVA